MNMDEKTAGLNIDLQELLATYFRRWWMIAVCAVLAAGISLGATMYFVTPTYRTNISVYVNNTRGVEDVEYVSSADLSASQRLVNTYVSITKSNRVLEKVAQKLDNKYSASAISKMVSAKQMGNTEIFSVYVVNSDPSEAARIANVMAEVVPVEIADIIEGSSARVIDHAKVPTSRHSPSYRMSCLIGGVIGALLSIVFITVRFFMDTRVKDEDDLTSLFKLPILGRIPEFSQMADSKEDYYNEGEKEEVK